MIVNTNSFKELIGKDNTDQALKRLIQLFPEDDEVQRINTTFKALKRHYNLGIISSSDHICESNKINLDLLTFLNTL